MNMSSETVLDKTIGRFAKAIFVNRAIEVIPINGRHIVRGKRKIIFAVRERHVLLYRAQ